ncbi:MAG: response regulator [Actinomycetota bacterium]|nr:response regulator [Actinomycetota bacterium]
MTPAPLTEIAAYRRPDVHILFADDDPGMRALVVINLEAEGFAVTTAEDGCSALEKVERIRPDLIVLDVMMPGRDGLDVLQELKKRPEVAGIPVVLLTAKATDADVWDGWKAGADDYMTKPFKPEDLAQFAHNILGTAK